MTSFISAKVINSRPNGTRTTDQDYTSNEIHLFQNGGIKFFDISLKKEFNLVLTLTVASTVGAIVGSMITGPSGTAIIVGFSSTQLFVKNVTGSFASSDTITAGPYSTTITLVGSYGVSGGRAVVKITRATTSQFSPEANLSSFVRVTARSDQDPTFQGSVPIKSVDISGTKKVFIEIPLNNVEDMSLNTDVNGLNIADIVSASSYPTHPNYIPLYSISGGVITDERVPFRIIASEENLDLSTFGGDAFFDDVHIGGDLQVDGDSQFDGDVNIDGDLTLNGDDITQVITNISQTVIQGAGTLSDFVCGEDFLKDNVGFVEPNVISANATQSITIGDSNQTIRHAHRQIADGTNFTSNQIRLSKNTSLLFDVYVRLESDDNGKPSGTLAHPSAFATIPEAIVPLAVGNVPIPRPAVFSLTPGTVFRVVVGVGTYGSEIPNPSAYLNIFRQNINTTTRIEKIYNSFTDDWFDYEADIVTAPTYPVTVGPVYGAATRSFVYGDFVYTFNGVNISENRKSDLVQTRATTLPFSFIDIQVYFQGNNVIICYGFTVSKIVIFDLVSFSDTATYNTTISNTTFARFLYDKEYTHPYIYYKERNTPNATPDTIIYRREIATATETTLVINTPTVAPPPAIPGANQLFLSFDFNSLLSSRYITGNYTNRFDRILTSSFTSDYSFNVTMGSLGSTQQSISVDNDGSFFYIICPGTALATTNVQKRLILDGSLVSSINGLVGISGYRGFIDRQTNRLFAGERTRINLSTFLTDFTSPARGVDIGGIVRLGVCSSPYYYYYKTALPKQGINKVLLYPLISHNQFTFFGGNGFEKNLMSKANATYSYKIDDIGIATDDFGIGENKPFIVGGTRKPITPSTQKTNIYIADTPGNYQETPGTNNKKIARSMDGETLFVNANV